MGRRGCSTTVWQGPLRQVELWHWGPPSSAPLCLATPRSAALHETHCSSSRPPHLFATAEQQVVPARLPVAFDTGRPPVGHTHARTAAAPEARAAGPYNVTAGPRDVAQQRFVVCCHRRATAAAALGFTNTLDSQPACRLCSAMGSRRTGAGGTKLLSLPDDALGRIAGLLPQADR